MTSREIVRRTLAYAYPERVARSFGDSDVHHVKWTGKTQATAWQAMGGGRWGRFDEWGNLWARVDEFSKGEVARGVLDDLAEIVTYQFPDYSRPEDYAQAAAARASHPEQWLIGELPGFAFNIARNLRKLDQYLMDLMLAREQMHALHDRIDLLLADQIRNYAAAGVDSVMFWEDWGTQHQTLISPKLWHAEFLPRFQKLCGLAHELGVKVFMHSCGQIEALVPDLMDAGIDLFQFDQPDLHGLDALAKHQARRPITFWCPIDIQTTLQCRDETRIRGKAREMLDKLWRGRGGFIAGYYQDNASLALDPQWQAYACDEFHRCGIRAYYDQI